MKIFFIILISINFSFANNSHKIGAGYSLLDLWIPGKYQLNYQYKTSNAVYEFMYEYGSKAFGALDYDLGDFTEQRFNFNKRNLIRDQSFHFYYGAFYRTFSINLGKKYLSALTNQKAHIDVVEIHTMGINLGLASIWKLNKKWDLNLDWIHFGIPVYNTYIKSDILNEIRNESQKDDIQSVISFIEKVPFARLLSFQFIYSF